MDIRMLTNSRSSLKIADMHKDIENELVVKTGERARINRPI
jgi:hypothetical protein